MDRIEKTIWIALVLLSTGLVILAVGGGGRFRNAGESQNPFDKSRVAKVQIVMSEKDWQWVCSNARAEQYVRGDSWFVGVLLLLIASSIGIATGTYLIVIILFAAALIALTTQHFLRNRLSLRRYANLMLSVDRAHYDLSHESLSRFLGERLDHLHLKTLSVMDGRVSLHYQFKPRRNFSSAEFIRGLHATGDAGKWKSISGLPHRRQGLFVSVNARS